MNAYRAMTIEALLAELEAWDLVLQQPKGPGTPSNDARETASHHRAEIEGWIARRNLEPRHD